LAVLINVQKYHHMVIERAMCWNVSHAFSVVIAYFIDLLSVLGNTRLTSEYVPAIHNG